MNFNEFVLSERASRDTIDVKRIYIDMADDLVAGILLSQIIFWHLPDQNGKSKLRVQHEGQMWIAKCRADWWDECRITEKQYDRAIGILTEKGLVITDTTLFAGKPSKIVRLDFDKFMDAYSAELNRGEERSSPKGNNELTERASTITETTPETTTIKSAAIASPLAEGIQFKQPLPREKHSKETILAAMGAYQAGREGVSDPRKAQHQFVNEIAPCLAQILQREPISTDKVAARQIWELKFDRSWLNNKLSEYMNGHGEQFRREGATPFWIKNELERERATTEKKIESMSGMNWG